LLAGLFLVACDLWSQQKEQKTPEVSCSVRGIVVREQGGEPIKGARVALAKRSETGENYHSTTSADGAFTFIDVVPGTYSLAVLKNGFVPQRYGQKKSKDGGVPLALRAGQKVQDIVFRLVAAAVISGRVVDEENEPVPGVLVQALSEYAERGLLSKFLGDDPYGRQRRPAGQALTDDRGEYRIYGLAPGRYYFRATDRGATRMSDYHMQSGWEWFATASAFGGKVYPPMLFPGTSQFEEASVVSVRAGEDVAIDFRLLPQVTQVTIKGQVVLPKAKLTRTDLWLEPLDPSNRWSFNVSQQASAKEDGKFEMKQVAPGEYFINARGEGETALYSGRQRITVVDTDVEVILPLSPGRKIVGRVTVEGGAKLSRQHSMVFLMPVEPGPFGGKDATVKDDGTFTISDVEENTYRVEIQVGEDAYLKSARYGMEDVLAGDLTISRETPQATLELVLSGATAKLQGTIIDARRKPAQGAQVFLVPQNKGWAQRRLRVARADQHGNFNIRGIAPGKYKLIGSVDDETELASLELSLGEAESRTVELKAEEQETASN
jgi:hypothetical protein